MFARLCNGSYKNTWPTLSSRGRGAGLPAFIYSSLHNNYEDPLLILVVSDHIEESQPDRKQSRVETFSWTFQISKSNIMKAKTVSRFLDNDETLDVSITTHSFSFNLHAVLVSYQIQLRCYWPWLPIKLYCLMVVEL